MNARTRLFGGEGGPIVRLEGTILAWIGLEGWLAVADELRRRWRPSARFYAQVDRHCRGLDVATIRASADLETLARADRVLEGMRRGLGRLRWPGGDRARAARLRVEVRNQATRVAAGRLDGPRRKGRASIPAACRTTGCSSSSSAPTIRRAARRWSGSAAPAASDGKGKAGSASMRPRGALEKGANLMTFHRTLHVLAHDPPPRLPEAALRHAVEEAAALTRRDGRDRHVLFNAAKRRVLVDDWPHDERRGFSVLADITLEAQP